jgi:hypothetical protein
MDASESPERASAIQDIVRLLGFRPPEVRHVPISFEAASAGHVLSIDRVLMYKINFSQNLAISPEVKDYLYPWLNNPIQGIAETVVYAPPSDEELLRYGGTNAIFADFRILVH